MVEHVSASEQQDRNQADGSPNISVLDDWHQIWPCYTQERHRAENSGRYGYHSCPVDGPFDLRMRSIGKISGNPCVHLLCTLGSLEYQYCYTFKFKTQISPVCEVISEGSAVRNSMRPACRLEE